MIHLNVKKKKKKTNERSNFGGHITKHNSIWQMTKPVSCPWFKSNRFWVSAAAPLTGQNEVHGRWAAPQARFLVPNTVYIR